MTIPDTRSLLAGIFSSTARMVTTEPSSVRIEPMLVYPRTTTAPFIVSAFSSVVCGGEGFTTTIAGGDAAGSLSAFCAQATVAIIAIKNNSTAINDLLICAPQ